MEQELFDLSLFFRKIFIYSLTIFFILGSIILLSALEVRGVNSWVLNTNESFENNPSISCIQGTGTWNIASSGCKSGTYCLQGSSSGTPMFCSLNSSYYYNLSDSTPLKIKGWSRQSTNNHMYQGMSINIRNSTNTLALGMQSHGTLNLRMFNQSFIAGSENLATSSFTGSNQGTTWLYFELNITGSYSNIAYYSDDTKTTLLKMSPPYAIGSGFTFGVNNAFIGFYGAPQTSSDKMQYDNIEVWQYLPSVTPNPSLSLNTNLINNTKNQPLNNLTISFNGTFANNFLSVSNCSLYNNNSLLNTSLNINLTLLNSFNLSFVNISQDYYYKINCSNSETNATTGLFKYSIDTIKPIIQSNFINNSVYYLLDIISFYSNFTDSNLYAYNITFRTPLNIISENYFSIGLSEGFASNLTSRNALSLGYNYTILVETWDSHTATAINFYTIEKSKSGVIINKDIKIYGDSIQSLELNKEVDKYTFDITFLKPVDEKNLQKIIYLDSPSFVYLTDSKYKLHFVSIALNKWIDFENNDISNYKVEKDIYGIYKITFDSKETTLKFNSIGDLNYVSQKFYYNIISTPSGSNVNMNETNALLNETLQETIKLREANEMIATSIFAVIFWLLFLVGLIYAPLSNKSGFDYLISALILIICTIMLMTLELGMTDLMKWVLGFACVLISLVYGTAQNEQDD